jgi:CheY-like chemotaxis protein
VSLISPLTAARNITLRVDAESVADHYVRADRQRLKQVLLNLVANAVKYNSANGHVVIACDACSTDQLRITVEDTGAGITTERLGRLFTPFDRLGAEQTGVEGTGLGLALSKSLAEAMGGRIHIVSTVGVGSTFAIELPRAESQLLRLARLTPAAGIPAVAIEDAMRVRTVLYVEDNLSNLALVQRILASRADIRLIPAMQGGLALELARLHKPDLVLLDLHLPDISGEDVLRQLRRSPDCYHIPVVVLSADATKGQPDRLLAAGAHAYITKPLDVKPFIQVLNDVLDARRAA